MSRLHEGRRQRLAEEYSDLEWKFFTQNCYYGGVEEIIGRQDELQAMISKMFEQWQQSLHDWRYEGEFGMTESTRMLDEYEWRRL